MGVIGAALGVGTMVGPALGGALVGFGSGVPYLAAAVLSLGSIAASIWLLPTAASSASSTPIREDQGTIRGISSFAAFRMMMGVPDLSKVLLALSLFYLSFGLFTSQLALVLSARFQWGGEAFGPSEIGYVLTAASIVTILVQITLRPLARLASDRTLASFAFLLLAVGFTTTGSTRGLLALSGAVLAIAVGSALARPALMSALSLAVPSHVQGAAMGITQGLGALINGAAALIGGLLINSRAYGIWGASIGLLAIGGAAALLLSTVRHLNDKGYES